MSYVDPTGKFGVLGFVVGAAVEIGFQAYSNYQQGNSLTNVANYNWTDVAISGTFSALAPGIFNVAKTSNNSLRVISKLVNRLSRPVGLKYATSLRTRVVNEGIKTGEIIGKQLLFQAGKSGTKKLNHMMCEAN